MTDFSINLERMDRGHLPKSDAKTGRRILIMGREKNETEAIARYLDFCGHRVFQTEQPKNAEIQAGLLGPEVLVCDLNPDSDFERTRVAAKIVRQHRADLVIISTHRRSVIRRRLPDLNPSAVLRKPISLDRLVRSVEKKTAR